MKITADTNVLVRVLTDDEPRQSRRARTALAEADAVIVTRTALCELVWVLAKGYNIPSAEIAETIRKLVGTEKVITDTPAVAAGLTLLEAGGDFADGIITYEGSWFGGDAFVSFDRKAVKLLEAGGMPATLLA